MENNEQSKPELEVRHKRSPTIGKLVEALAKAQLEFGRVLKDATNPFYKSRYATLDSVVGATREQLAKNGLVIMALPDEFTHDGRMRVTSILAHSSDEWIESTVTMPTVEKITPQEMGKLLTYARRYQWAGFTGTAPEDDDDGNQASGNTGSREQAQEVGKAKIEATKARMAQQDPSRGPDQLICYPSGDAFEVTGDPSIMQAHKELLLSYGKKLGPQAIVTMSAESLDTFRHIFTGERGGVLTSLKAKKVAEDAKALKDAVK